MIKYLKRFYTLNLPPLATVIVLSLCGVLVYLGHWQWQRAKWKTNYLHQQYEKSKASPVDLTTLLKQPLPHWDFTPLRLKGQFDYAHLILLDNRYRNHQLGFEVLIPFHPQGTGKWLLINQGWLPRTSKAKLSEVSSSKPAILTGIIHLPSTKGVILGNNITTTSPMLTIQQIRLKELSKQLNRSFFPFILRLNPSANTPYDRHWSTVTLTPARHQAYAIQWYCLAITLLVCFFATNIKVNKE